MCLVCSFYLVPVLELLKEWHQVSKCTCVYWVQNPICVRQFWTQIILVFKWDDLYHILCLALYHLLPVHEHHSISPHIRGVLYIISTSTCDTYAYVIVVVALSSFRPEVIIVVACMCTSYVILHARMTFIIIIITLTIRLVQSLYY